MKNKSGFTVIEVLVLAVFLTGIGVLFFMQKAEIEAKNRDDQRKTAINAMHYSLEEVFFKESSFYPTEINEKNLISMDPQLFTDPNGINLGEPESDYRYEATYCSHGKCKKYTLRATLEKEDDFIKKNRE